MKNNIITFDLETTGTDPQKDRIVQFSFSLMGWENIFSGFVNPETEIPDEATAVHGITNERVAEELPFSVYAQDLINFLDIENNAIAGFNILNFDLPLLAHEFKRAGQQEFADKIFKAIDNPESSEILIIDAMQIFNKKFRRTLIGAADYYLHEDFNNDAHDAKADVEMTERVLSAQFTKYNLSIETAAALSTEPPNGFMDRASRIKTGGIFNFGKYKDIMVQEINQKDRRYITWILEKSEMPQNTKNIIRRLIK